MNLISLASGSKGNAYVFESAGTVILVDCGLSYRELSRRAKERHVDLGSVSALVVTHSHTDHTAGIGMFLSKHDVPVYANLLTAETVVHSGGVDENAFVCFEDGQDFTVGSCHLTPFSVPHDTADPVGYLIESEEGVYFHATDVGSPLDSIGRMLARADMALLESNFDPVMLATSGRPRQLIERIRGPRGHLANDEAADLVARFASPSLRRLALGHLSRDCNVPDFAEREMRSAFERMQRSDIALTVLTQDETYVV